MHHVISCKATYVRCMRVLAVTCHLRFWQNDRGLLRATAVTRGWNEYRNKSQHRKLTLEKKILPPLLQGFEPATFRSRVRHSPLYQYTIFWVYECVSIPARVCDPACMKYRSGEIDYVCMATYTKCIFDFATTNHFCCCCCCCFRVTFLTYFVILLIVRSV